MNDADSAAAVAVAPAARHWLTCGLTRTPVSAAAPAGNSQTDTATDIRV